MPKPKTYRRNSRAKKRVSLATPYRSSKKNHILKQLQRRFRNFALGLIVVIATLFLFVLLSVWQFLRTPLVEASEVILPEGRFDQENRYTVMLLMLDDLSAQVPRVESINLLSINPVNATAAMVSIPNDLDMSELTDLGEIKLSSLYALGGMTREQQNGSIPFMAETLSKALAVPIDKYLMTDQSGMKAFSQVLEQKLDWGSFDELFSLFNLSSVWSVAGVFREYVKSDFTTAQTITLVKFLFNVREDKIQKIELSAGDIDNHLTLASLFGDHLVDTRLYEERLSVQVLNGTVVSGVAGLVSRYIENMGGRVVGMGNTREQDSENSYILARNPEAYSVRRLSWLFNIPEIREYSDTYGIRDRADITIVIGLDLAREL